MKKLLLSILSVTSLTSFSQWVQTSNYSGADCINAFSKLYVSHVGATGLDESANEGSTWSVANTGLSTGTWFGTLYNNTHLFALQSPYSNKIYLSTTGNTWVQSNTGIPGSESIASMCSMNSTVMAASSTGGTIYQSTNSGASWAVRSSALNGKLITTIRNVNNTIWAGTTGATSTLIAKSTDGGLTFTNVSPPLSGAFYDKYITCVAGNATVVVAGTLGGKIVKTLNGGTSWTNAYNLTTGSMFSISDIYISGTNILVACDSGFVYSKDNGTTWTKDNSGLTFQQYTNLQRVTMTNSYIIATTRTGLGAVGGVFRILKSQIFSGINENSLTLIESKVFPNPSSGKTTIQADELIEEKDCLVKLHDVLGREIAEVEMQSGKANIDADKFQKGLYTYTIYNKTQPVGKGKLLVN